MLLKELLLEMEDDVRSFPSLWSRRDLGADFVPCSCTEISRQSSMTRSLVRKTGRT